MPSAIAPSGSPNQVSAWLTQEQRLMAERVCLGPQPPRKPKCSLPPEATDCHCHVFEAPERFQIAQDVSYAPALAPLAEYLRMCETVGIGRTVQVNASVYGFDNSPCLPKPFCRYPPCT